MKKWLLVLILIISLIIGMFFFRDDIARYVFPSPTPTITSTPTASATFTITPAPTFTPTPSLTPTLIPSPTITPTPLGGSVALLIDSGPTGGSSWFFEGQNRVIYVKNLATNDITRIGWKNARFEDISSDKKHLLLSEGNQLFVTDIYGNSPILISSSFLGHRNEIGIWIEITAHWVNSGDVVFLSKEGSQNIINIVSLDDLNNPRQVYSTTNTIELNQTNGYGILWDEHLHTHSASYREGTKWLALDSDEIKSIRAYIFALSPDGTYLAYQAAGSYDQLHLNLLNLLSMESREIRLPEIPEVSNLYQNLEKVIWGPDGEFLLVLWAVCDPSCDAFYTQMIDFEGNEINDFPNILTPRDGISWSPDGHYLMIGGRYIINIENLEFQELIFGEYANRFFWFPSSLYIAVSGSEISADSEYADCERTDPLCYEYYFIEKSIYNGQGNFTFDRAWYADDGGVETIELKNWTTGEILRQYIFMFNPILSTYTASLPINGNVINFHGEAILITQVEEGWWQIQLDENVPPGVSRTIYINQNFKELSWKLPFGYTQFSETNKLYFPDIQ